MNDFEDRPDQLCAIYVDMGTTNARVWLLHGNKVLARAGRQVGVRDTTHDLTTQSLRNALRQLITEVQELARHASSSCAPVCVVAAGMIGSPIGLAELAHIAAPAGLQELSAAASQFQFPEVTALPFLLVPGVRSGSISADVRSLDHADVMRGEETLCVGLHALGLVACPAVVLTLGSHWKAIRLDAAGRIQESTTSLSGEMIHAVQTETILSSSVGSDWPKEISTEWLESGMNEQRRSGLSRALFCVRLLDLNHQATQDERFAYLLGAFIAAELDALVTRGVLNQQEQVIISGHAMTAEAWAFALARMSVTATVLAEEATEAAFLAGLNRILVEQVRTGKIGTSGTKGTKRSMKSSGA